MLLRGYVVHRNYGSEYANIPGGGTVAVSAQGPVGPMATVGARLLGAGLVIVVEAVPNRNGARWTRGR